MSHAPVIFDVDGVLADFVLGFTELAQRMGLPALVYSTPQQAEWEMLGGLSPENISRVWEHIKQDKTFWLDLSPLVSLDEIARIAELMSCRPVYFVTARVGHTAKWQTETWLAEQVLEVPTVIISRNKGDIAAAVGASHLIDDKAGNAVYTGYTSGRTTPYLLDRPYNRGFDPAVIGSRVRRVQTVSEFLDDVERG